MLICYVLFTAFLTTTVMSLKLQILTYNTGNTLPAEDLTPLLGLQFEPDIISVGFEELGDTSAWENEVDRILRKHGFYRVKLVTLSLMQIAVFAKKTHLPFISHVDTEYTKTGFAGTYGNKGGTTVRFRLYGKTVAIVNTHLSAHMEQVQIRDEEYWNIMSEQDFHDPTSEHLYDHDYLFWSGDLNYRIEHDNQEVRKTVDSGQYLDLLVYDQLRQEQQSGHAFIGFHEADITFPPTYKFDPDTDIYDTSAKGRVPAWCDRVLWRIKAEREEIVNALNWGYDSSESLSDSSLSDAMSDLSNSSSDAPGHCEADGTCASKLKKKKKNIEDEDLSHSSIWERMRRRTVSLMKKTAVYAAATGSAMLRSATGSAPIKINKADVADPERFRDLMNTLERHKVSVVKHKYENCVRALVYKSYPEFKKSDHKPVSALLEIGVNCTTDPLIKFSQSVYSWTKGEKLTVTLEIKKGVSLSSWDWVALVEKEWTDANKHYITYQYVPNDNLNVTFPWENHPGVPKTMVVVFTSSKMSAPLAMAEVTCK